MLTQTLWRKVLSELEVEVSPAVFNTMFKQTQLSGVSNDVARISCKSPVIAHLIETRYYALLKRVVDRHSGKNVSLIFSVNSALKKPNGEKTIQDVGPLFQASDNFASLLKKHYLHPDYTFENFAVSTTNQLAFAAASHVSKNLGNSYNPLFIYGGVGVGKTHLMQAIAHAVLNRDNSVRLVLCAGEDFTNEIIEAIRNKSTPAFRSKFRQAQILCIDDIQFIAGKEAVQEEFFHTFNAVLRTGGQIVLTSDKAPSEIEKLEARIKSRLEGGLLVDIAPPDFELRVAILLIKAKNKKVDLPISLAKIIATSIIDTRKLEGFLTRIITEADIKNAYLSEELVLKILGKKQNGETKVQNLISKDSFVSTVCSYFDIKASALKSKRRDQNIVLPRQILMYLLRNELKLPLTEIGYFIGGRDHTTVMHAVGKIAKLSSSSEKIRLDILGIKKFLYE